MFLYGLYGVECARIILADNESIFAILSLPGMITVNGSGFWSFGLGIMSKSEICSDSKTAGFIFDVIVALSINGDSGIDFSAAISCNF